MISWTLKIGISDNLIEDGFDFDEKRCASLGSDILPYSRGEEVTVEVLSAPNHKTIRKMQGYTD